jgi:hypothetical protein
LNLPFILWWAAQTGYAYLQEKLSQHEARTAAAFLASADFQSDKVLQLFFGWFSICLVGRDAGTVATNYMHSKVGINYVKHGGTNLPYLSISQQLASKVKSDARKKKRRVEVYRRSFLGVWKKERPQQEAVALASQRESEAADTSPPASPTRRGARRSGFSAAKAVSDPSDESFRRRSARNSANQTSKETHRPHGVLLPSVESESKQYVEKFLENEKMHQEHAVESLAQQSLDKIGKLEADGDMLKDKLDKIEQGLLLLLKMAGEARDEDGPVETQNV